MGKLIPFLFIALDGKSAVAHLRLRIPGHKLRGSWFSFRWSPVRIVIGSHGLIATVFYFKNYATGIQRQHGMPGSCGHLQHRTGFPQYRPMGDGTLIVKIQHHENDPLMATVARRCEGVGAGARGVQVIFLPASGILPPDSSGFVISPFLQNTVGENTRREHAALIRQHYQYREFAWPWTFRLTRLYIPGAG